MRNIMKEWTRESGIIIPDPAVAIEGFGFTVGEDALWP